MLRHLVPVALVLLSVRAPAGGGSPDPGSRACLSCHASVSEHSHPLGMAARPVIRLPLTRGGLVGCVTCHEEPASISRHALTGRGTGLRRAPGVLCGACHAGSVDPGSVLAHGLRLGRAHLSSIPEPAGGSGLGLDRESRLCLSCHDGEVASSARVRVVSSYPGLEPGLGSGLKSMHPVGVRQRRGREMADPRDLPSGVRLFSGKVGCGSCHSVYSQARDMLSVDNRGSGLCLTCHLK